MGATNVILLDNNTGDEPSIEIDVNNGRDIFAHYLTAAEVFAIMSDGFIRTTTSWERSHASVGVGDIAADSNAFSYPLFKAKYDCTIKACSVGVDTTVGVDVTNFNTLALKQTGSSTDLGTLTTAAGFTIKVPRDITIAAAPAKLKAGSTLYLTFTKTLTGKALSGLVISFSYTIDQAQETVGDVEDNIIRIINDIGTLAVIRTNESTRDPLVIRQYGVEKFRININGLLIGDAPDQYYYQIVNLGTIAAADSTVKKSPILRTNCIIEVQKCWIGSISDRLVFSDTAYMQLKLTDGTNTIASAYVRGPHSGGTSLYKGILYDMGAISSTYKTVAASGVVQLEYLATGAPSDIPGLTVVLAYKKKS